MKKALYSQPNWLSKRTGTYTPPAAPGDISNLAVTATTNSSIAVSWDAPISGGPVSSYQVQVQLAGGDWSALVFSGSSLTTSKITTGLSGNVEYDVRVRATNGGGQSAWLDVTSYTNPNTPTGLVATPSSGNVNLEWDDIAGLTYKVYRNTSNNSGTATLIDSSEAGPEYDDSSVVNGTTYYYWLKATNSAGDSGFSSVASAMPEAGSTISPGVSESFAVDSLTDSSISVSWNSPVTGDPVDLYRLRWKNSADTWASVLGTDTTTDLDYIVTGLDDNSEYDIEVRAENAGGNSAYVSLSEILTKPSLPSNFTATSQDEAVDLDWDNVAGITWDVLANSSNDLGTASVIASGLVTNSYTETGLTNGVTRYYWLRAINASGYVGEATASTTPALSPSWGSNPVITSDADIDNPLVGDSLSVSDTSGAIGDPAPTMTYQWRRNSSGWVDISGATSIDYTLSSGDVGYSVRCNVLASNIGGSDDAPSNSTGVVAGAAESTLVGYSYKAYNDNNLAFPAGIAVGDLMLFHCSSFYDDAVPAGWNAGSANGLNGTPAATRTNEFFWRYYDGTEGASLNGVFQFYSYGTLTVLRNVDDIDITSNWTVEYNDNSFDVAIPTMAGELWCMTYINTYPISGAGSATSPSGFTDIAANPNLSGYGKMVAERKPDGATGGTQTWTSSVLGESVIIPFVITPTP